MLDKESIDTYRSIHLNRDLRCEILQLQDAKKWKPSVQLMRPAAILASTVLVLGIILFRPTSPLSHISVQGNDIGKKAQTLFTESVEYTGGIMRVAASPEDTLPLQTAPACAALEISAGQDVFITVSSGILLLSDSTGIPTFAGQSGTAPDGASVYISLEGCEASSPISLLVSDFEGKIISSYRIAYQPEKTVWQIYRVNP